MDWSRAAAGLALFAAAVAALCLLGWAFGHELGAWFRLRCPRCGARVSLCRVAWNSRWSPSEVWAVRCGRCRATLRCTRFDGKLVETHGPGGPRA